jgi:acetyl esterase/lipase
MNQAHKIAGVSGWHTYIRLLMSALLLLTIPINAQQSSKGREDPAFLKPLLPKRIVYSVPGMEKIKARKEIVWKQVDGTELKLDVYAPPRQKRAQPLPAIIFIHGGPIPDNMLTEPKEWGVFVSFGQLAAASGFVGVTFNHRFYRGGQPRNAQEDVIDLIAYVRINAATLGIDPERLTLWAFSGGGSLLSAVLRDPPSYIRCLVAYYAVLDKPFLTGGLSAEALLEFSPLHQLQQRTAAKSDVMPLPILIARAGKDMPAINGTIDRFVQAALALNMNLELHNHSMGRHSFDVLNDDARTHAIIRRTMEFIRTGNQLMDMEKK